LSSRTGRNTLGTWFGETGLKIRPDVFRHDNCERFTLLKSTIFFSQKRKGKQNSSTAHSGSYVRCLHVGADICWHDQISAQMSADICRYLADICSKAQLTIQSIVVVVVSSESLLSSSLHDCPPPPCPSTSIQASITTQTDPTIKQDKTHYH
jgi:hypothetical protein